MKRKLMVVVMLLSLSMMSWTESVIPEKMNREEMIQQIAEIIGSVDSEKYYKGSDIKALINEILNLYEDEVHEIEFYYECIIEDRYGEHMLMRKGYWKLNDLLLAEDRINAKLKGELTYSIGMGMAIGTTVASIIYIIADILIEEM